MRKARERQQKIADERAKEGGNQDLDRGLLCSLLVFLLHFQARRLPDQ